MVAVIGFAFSASALTTSNLSVQSTEWGSTAVAFTINNQTSQSGWIDVIIHYEDSNGRARRYTNRMATTILANNYVNYRAYIRNFNRVLRIEVSWNRRGLI